jgi:coenzyme PQQ precursor peptide PqqA
MLKEIASMLIVRWRNHRANSEETKMSWKTPKIVEVQVGMEINMYACAARK